MSLLSILNGFTPLLVDNNRIKHHLEVTWNSSSFPYPNLRYRFFCCFFGAQTCWVCNCEGPSMLHYKRFVSNTFRERAS